MRNHIPEKDPKFLSKSSFLTTRVRLMLILVSINLEIISIYAPGQFVVGMKTFVLYDLEGRGLRGEPQLCCLYTNSRCDAQMHQSTWYDSQKHQEFLATGCRGYKLWNRQAEVAIFCQKEPSI